MAPYSLTRRLFTPAVTLPEPEPEGAAYWFVFQGYRLLLDEKPGNVRLPEGQPPDGLDLRRRQFLGWLGEQPCYAAEVAENDSPPEGMAFYNLRRMLGLLDEDLFWTAGRAVQIVDWDRTNQYCGRCGSPTDYHTGERAKVCPACALTTYPRLAPAIIVAVVRDGRLLLARSHRHPQGLYSVLAGFVEPGETLEECVAREVKEEVGIDVQNVRYFGSQPWPFPHSLMIAFTCDYAGGEIALDTAEMAEAAWFRAAELPTVPPPPTISRRLIDWFVTQHGAG